MAEPGKGLVPPAPPAKALDNPNPAKPNQDPAAGGQGGEGSVSREWMKDLPEPLRAHKTLEKFADQEWKANLAKSYVELEGKLGKSIVIPDESAGPEEFGKLYSRLGRPESPEKYDIPTGALDAEFEGLVRKKAFEAGASQKVVAGFVESVKEAVALAVKRDEDARKAEVASAEAKRLETANALRKELGSEYDIRMSAAANATKTLFPSTLADKLKEAGFMDDPDFLKALSVVGSEMGDTGLLLGKPDPASKDPYNWMREKYGPKA